jgi:hypothetical protein
MTTEELFEDTEQAAWAGAHQVGEETCEGALFATLGGRADSMRFGYLENVDIA